jgi:hypothetical protein
MNALRSLLFFPLLLLCLLFVVSCGDKDKVDPKVPEAEPGMDDALAL